jgi:hypothetical protein
MSACPKCGEAVGRYGFDLSGYMHDPDSPACLRAQLAALQSQLDDIWHALGLSPSDFSQLIDVITDLRAEARRSADVAAQLELERRECQRKLRAIESGCQKNKKPGHWLAGSEYYVPWNWLCKELAALTPQESPNGR